MKIHPPLIELLGGRWRFEAPIAAAAWNHEGAVAAFGLADGTVGLVRANWEGGPEVIPRPTGGIEVRPPTVSSPPVARVSVHKGASHTLVPEPGGGFLSGGDDGRVMRIERDGIVTQEMGFPERFVTFLDTGLVGWRACVAGREAIITGRYRHVLTLPSEGNALAFDPLGRCLAVAYQDGISIWSDDGAPTRDLKFRGLPQTLVWSPDSAWLAVGLDAGVRAWRLADGVDVALSGFSGVGRALSFSSDARLLATSGARRVVYWQLGPEYLAEPGECGLASTSAPVCVVAFHPARLLVAAGYGSGAILLCQPGTEDVLFAKGAGGGALVTLAWSPEGQRLAFATEGGEAGIMLLPDGLFRHNALAAARH
jgi:WD40 repeat protein